MNLTALIESAELCFKQILEDFFVAIYSEKNLISHGIDHHRRVWSYAKELLTISNRQFKSEPPCSPVRLIITCYMHDIGMSVESGPRHGKHSRDLCIQFLNKNNLDENDYTDVLETIENHDRKDYTSETGINDLLTILSVADDLDAFGFTGIYRYSEIYLTRGINPHETGHLIRESAERRFNNFIKNFGADNNYVQKHRERYKILDNFFMHYNKQVNSYNFEADYPEGYCGVIQLLILLIRNKMLLKDLFAQAGKYRNDDIIFPFLENLKLELI
jgi:hypothetical protein